MLVRRLHRWDVPLPEATRIQREYAPLLNIAQPLRKWNVVVGADVSCDRFSSTIFAAVVVWRASDNAILETRAVVRTTAFPYRSGYLSFREAPAVLAALKRVRHEPDVVLLDGQGLAHPRRLGLASHVGMCLDVATVGVAKSRLTGHYVEPGPSAGNRSALTLHGDTVGTVLRTKLRSTPLFVSPGNGIDVDSAVEVVWGCLRGYRLPEPTRLAHLAVNAFRRRRSE